MGTDTEQTKTQEFRDWHAFEENVIYDDLQTGKKGLSNEEALKRLHQYGPNSLPPPPKKSALKRFLLQFHNVLIYVLLGSAAITLLLADVVDSMVILGVVIINAIIGFIQEGKAEKAVDAIRNILTHNGTVVREGKKATIPVDNIVPGDVVFLQSGDKVPADLRLFEINDLLIEEAPLTGESVPAEKDLALVNEKATIGDRHNMAFSGTLVTYGQGYGVVVATGVATEIGKISTLLARVESLQTRLTMQINEFSKWLTGGILILAFVTLCFGLFVRDYTFAEIFFASVALAVAAIPEGLPAIITITLALGVQRMAKERAIIRRLPAVETLGSVTVICSDKTGTLTRNEMMAKTIATTDREIDIEGAGYIPTGNFLHEGNIIEPLENSILHRLVLGGMLCNEGTMEEIGGQWEVHGDPTEGALIAMAIKAGMRPEEAKAQHERVDVEPFSSENKFMATLNRETTSGVSTVFLKGAPEKVLAMCKYQRSSSEDEPVNLDYWHKEIERIAAKGMRTLAIAEAPALADSSLEIADYEGKFIILGIVGLLDPPRQEAIEAVRECRKAGVKVVMITGDHALTATAVGEQLGLDTTHGAVTGVELEAMEDEQLREVVTKANIFARVSPEHKLKLVTALQQNGQVTSMTGDGINDAPALKRADVGVAMGLNSTEAAKEAAEMVLADNNFASIAHAVKEGRTVYDNIRKTLVFILPTNGAEAGIIVASVLMGVALPITPLQILWINMVTAVTLGLSLAFEEAEKGVMTRPPRPPEEPLLSQFLSWRIIFVSAIMVVITLGLFLWDIQHGETLDMARTTATNTLIFFEVFYLLNTRYLKDSVFSREGFLGSRVVLLAIGIIVLIQIPFTYMPIFQTIFSTASIPLSDWGRLLVCTFMVFLIVELEKYLMRRFEFRKKYGMNRPRPSKG